MSPKHKLRYKPLELKRTELPKGQDIDLTKTPDIFIPQQNQMCIYPKDVIIQIWLLRALLILINHIPMFREQNPALAGLSLVMELTALQSYVFEVAEERCPMFYEIPKYCFIPLLLGFDDDIKMKTMEDLEDEMFDLMYDGDETAQVKQIFLSIDNWRSCRFPIIIYQGSWLIDPPGLKGQSLITQYFSPLQNSERPYRRWFITSNDDSDDTTDEYSCKDGCIIDDDGDIIMQESLDL